MRKTIIWIGALVAGAILGVLGIAWLNDVMNFVATVYTRLFQLLAVPTIVLAVITTFATFGSKGSGRIFGRTLIYTLLTTFAAAAVGALLYVVVAPGNLPAQAISQAGGSAIANSSPLTLHFPTMTTSSVSSPTISSNLSLKAMSSRCCCWPLP